MMRTVAFALAAMAATSLAAASSASAMGHGVGGSSHAVSGHASGIGPSASFHHFAGPGHNFASHHHRHRHRVVFVGAPFGYDCLSRPFNNLNSLFCLGRNFADRPDSKPFTADCFEPCPSFVNISLPAYCNILGFFRCIRQKLFGRFVMAFIFVSGVFFNSDFLAFYRQQSFVYRLVDKGLGRIISWFRFRPRWCLRRFNTNNRRPCKLRRFRSFKHRTGRFY